MIEDRNTRNWVRRLLRSEVRLTEAFTATYPARHVAESYVTSPKLLMVQGGALEYQLGASRLEVPAGSVLYRPPRSHSRWRVTSSEAVQLAWAEFSPPDDLPVPETAVVREVDAAVESSAMARLLWLWSGPPGESAALIAEAELKSAIARFFLVGRMEISPGIHIGATHRPLPPDAPGKRRPPADAAVHAAVDFLGAHYADPDALDRMWANVRLSPSHFRVVFRRVIGMNPRSHLVAIRMGAARAMLLRGDRTVKEVASAVGLYDASYFSRQYRAFWKRPPIVDLGAPI